MLPLIDLLYICFDLLYICFPCVCRKYFSLRTWLSDKVHCHFSFNFDRLYDFHSPIKVRETGVLPLRYP